MKEDIQRLRSLAQQVQTYQTERGLSDAKLFKAVGSIGSTKTYKRILDQGDDLTGLSIENQLRNYSAAVEHVAILRTRDADPEIEYQDFDNIVDSLGAISRAVGEETIARFVVIQGETGTGKDAVKNAILKRWENISILVEATEYWKESAATPIKDILAAIDLRKRGNTETGEAFKTPNNPHRVFDLVIDELKDSQSILIINEAHHMGPRGLNLIKTIINKTPTVVVFLCIPSLLNRLMKSAYEECIQLFGNRLCERVQLSNPIPSEIEQLLDRRKVKFADDTTRADCASAIAAAAATAANWRYVNRISRALRLQSQGKPVTLDTFTRVKKDLDAKTVPSRYTKVKGA